MGDTGPLALGGGLAAAAILMKLELLSPDRGTALCDRGTFCGASGRIF